MSPVGTPGKLIALVADRDIEETVARLFARPESLGIAQFPFEIRRHPGRDSGCRADAANFLRQFLRTCDHALVVLDRDGCGRKAPREQVEVEIERRLVGSGWGDRAAAVVIQPELEAWVWSESPAVSKALGWGHEGRALRSCLANQGLWDQGRPKPQDPKAAMLVALERAPSRSRRRRTARLFGEIAANTSLLGCQDAAFAKLRGVLRKWFPRTAS